MYKIHPTKGSRLSYTLNIIDTPGFGDTRGIERDGYIVDQIRELFSSRGSKGVMNIDAVCFIVKAPDARLTAVQRYIFHSIMSLFGKDIESNMCTLITFADGETPPVLASLAQSKLPFGKEFIFNNSALFTTNKSGNHGYLSATFWQMGCRSFKLFFDYISHLKTTSLVQTKEVLDERERLKTILSNIRPKLTAGLSKVSELEKQLDIFRQNENKIKDNKNFEYTVNETKQKKVELPEGQHVTNCLTCNITCHENCRIADDDQKQRCLVMNSSGECTICKEKCMWDMHKNTKYIFEYITVPVTRTYSEMKKAYEEANQLTLTYEKCIENFSSELIALNKEVSDMMKKMKACKMRLSEIALAPEPFSDEQHVDMLILAEETEQNPGYQERIETLIKMKNMRFVDQDAEIFVQKVHDSSVSVKTVVKKDEKKSKIAFLKFW